MAETSGLTFDGKANSLEFISGGTLYMGTFGGQFFTVDKTTALVTHVPTTVSGLIEDSGTTVISSGDLAWNAFTTTLYMTSPTGVAGGDSLYELNRFTGIATLIGQITDTSTDPDTLFPRAFALDFTAAGLCAVTNGGALVMISPLTAEVIGMPKVAATDVNDPVNTFIRAWGGSANFVGGMFVPLETTALFISEIQTSTGWALPIVLTGVGVLVYKFGNKAWNS